MRRLRFDAHGGPEVLYVEQCPEPEGPPRPGCVRVEIAYSAVNYNDIWAREGLPLLHIPLPHVSGSDAAGRVVAVGEGVRSCSVDDLVAIFCGISCRRCPAYLRGDSSLCPELTIWGFQTGPLEGGHCEIVDVEETQIVPVPEGYTLQEGAAMVSGMTTAWRMLVTKAQIQPGQDVLVWGAAGNLGHLAVQLAQACGGRAIGVCAGEDKARFVRSLGAEVVIDRETQDVRKQVRQLTGGDGVDIVFEHSGSDTWPISVRSTKAGGAVVVCGATSGFLAETDLRSLWNKEQRHLGSHLGSLADCRAAMRFAMRAGIRPRVHSVHQLEDAAKAQDLLATGQACGRVLMEPSRR